MKLLMGKQQIDVAKSPGDFSSISRKEEDAITQRYVDKLSAQFSTK